MLLMRLPSVLVQLDIAAGVKCLGLAEQQDRIGCFDAGADLALLTECHA